MKPPLHIAFLTGQSDPHSCALTATQTRFLRELPVPEAAKLYLNFPYDPALPEARPIPLALASWNNVRQSLEALTPGFARRYAPPVAAVIERAERTLFLAGSCGIHLLRSLRLPPALLHRLAVFAYGPVALGRPDCRHLIVGSEGDRISRAFFPRPDVMVNSDHLRYLDDPALAAACRAFLRTLDGGC